MDCVVHVVAKSWTRPSDFYFHFIYIYIYMYVIKKRLYRHSSKLQ